MSKELVSILVLIAIFAIGTLRPINMGLLGITAAFIVGSAYGVSEDDIFAGFPAICSSSSWASPTCSRSPTTTAPWTGSCTPRYGRSAAAWR